jgi:RHS repeat-associated protein
VVTKYYPLTCHAENRLNSVTQGGQTTTFTYDADGQRVVRETVTDTIVYVGSHYEARFEEGDMLQDLDGDCDVDIVDIMMVASRWGCQCGDDCYDSLYDFDSDCWITVADIMQVAAHWRETCPEELVETVKYYTLGGRRVAMRKGDTLYYLFSDHLGSISVVYETISNTWVTQRYYPWGTIRPGPNNALPTDYTFTGQKLDESTELMYYGARYYDPDLGRFVQADTIVPEPGNPQALNRYSYVYNNPLNFIDPTGYFSEEAIKEYLQRIYGEQWKDIYSQWRANEAWWTMLSEAQPGDILVMTGDQEQDRYGLILGDIAGQGTEDDVLWGVAPTQGIPRAFEEFEVGELQDVGAWVDGEVTGLARLEKGRYVRYWTPELHWSKPFLNLPAVYRPEVGQTLHPWSSYMIGLLWAEVGGALLVGTEIIGAAPAAGPFAPLVVGVGLVPIGLGVWLGAHTYNLSVTPKSDWDGH